jgi:hypothetical protein
MGGVAFRSRAARRSHGGVRCLGGWGIRARHWASASGRLRCCVLRLAGGWLPATWRDAGLVAARLPRRRHAGAVFSRQCHTMGDRIAGCRRGRGHERARRVTRRRTVARRIPADGGVGVWTMKRSVKVVDPATLEAAVHDAFACGDPIRAAAVKDLTRRHRIAARSLSRAHTDVAAACASEASAARAALLLRFVGCGSLARCTSEGVATGLDRAQSCSTTVPHEFVDLLDRARHLRRQANELGFSQEK